MIKAPPQGPSLRDIHPAPPPPWWPPAVGWWVLAALLVILVCAAAWWWRRRRGRRLRRRSVETAVQRLQRDYQSHGDAATLAAGLSMLLRRVAQLHEPRAAADAGAAWRELLQRFARDDRQLDILLAVDRVMYRRHADIDADASVDAVRRWLEKALRGSGR